MEIMYKEQPMLTFLLRIRFKKPSCYALFYHGLKLFSILQVITSLWSQCARGQAQLNWLLILLLSTLTTK